MAKKRTAEEQAEIDDARRVADGLRASGETEAAETYERMLRVIDAAEPDQAPNQ